MAHADGSQDGDAYEQIFRRANRLVSWSYSQYLQALDKEQSLVRADVSSICTSIEAASASESVKDGQDTYSDDEGSLTVEELTSDRRKTKGRRYVDSRYTSEG